MVMVQPQTSGDFVIAVFAWGQNSGRAAHVMS